MMKTQMMNTIDLQNYKVFTKNPRGKFLRALKKVTLLTGTIRDDDDVMTYNDKLKVWIDDTTNLYYRDNNGTDALGTVVGGVALRPFQKSRKLW